MKKGADSTRVVGYIVLS